MAGPGTNSPARDIDNSIRSWLPWITVVVLIGSWLVSYTQLREEVRYNADANVRQDKIIERVLQLQINDVRQTQDIQHVIQAMEELKAEVRAHIREDHE